ncbi:MAG TPA: fibronectin type III domain-containing protein [Planctomycetota bacterium]|nr:fibronectin type III domain-containing protein [Planctomycetota bacterium]
MKPKALLPCLAVVLALFPFSASGQQAPATFAKSEWTWVSGSNTVNHPGVYGTKGIASPTNIPGSRQQASSWTDTKGNFWVFGGFGEDVFSTEGWLNDLWKFDGTNWTWISGGNTANSYGVYGTQGIPNPSNLPGGRAQAAAWLDPQGTVWIFGGNGSGAPYSRGNLNDLWKFDGTNWTWISGSQATGVQGTYATKGTSNSLNCPGSRQNPSSWLDSSGRLWLFAGFGSDLGGSTGYLNDLWMFDGSNWSWMGGSNTSYHTGHYGTQGVADPANVPSGRMDAASWTDNSGALWIFGGLGYDSTFTLGSLNDLWKFDGTLWTWVAGSATANQKGIYGTKGTGAPGNYPGGRMGTAAWMEKGGVLWLFGGNGLDSAGSQGMLNDLWSWNGTVWTWISGSNLINQSGSYGTLGVAAPTNVPGARQDAALFLTAVGDLCLFSGQGVDSAGSQGQLNDLWHYRPGTNPEAMPAAPKGVAAAPGHGAVQLSWNASLGATSYTISRGTTSGGETLLVEGVTSLHLVDKGLTNGTKYYYVVAAAGPTGISGFSAEVSATPLSTLPAAPVLSDTPGTGKVVLTWTHTGTSYQVSRSLSNGGPYAALGGSTTKGTLTDTGLVNGTTYYYVVVATNSVGSSVFSNQVAATPSGPPPSGSWTWMTGSNAQGQGGSWGTLGIPSPSNTPGSRSASATWTDFSGNFWLFGGGAKDSNGGNGPMSDLWKFDGTNWTWMSGPNLAGLPGVYGTKGVAAPTNIPGAREYVVSWRDLQGNLWLFGGYGLDTNFTQGELNDLWKFDGTNWTWVAGSNVINSVGVYGTKGVAAPGNTPGGRDSSAFALDGGGNFWLFGGQSLSNNHDWNDLWKFDGTNWTWISGSNTTDQTGTYGTKGVGAPANIPGARAMGAGWMDSSGRFWLFGGNGETGPSQKGNFNDLWKFDGTNWIWISGPANSSAPRGVYGTQGVPAAANTPGIRFLPAHWIDSSNNLWIFGGGGNDFDWATGSLNDLWKFDGTNWTWISGADTDWQIGTYGTKGVAAAGNVPGARNGSLSFIDISGRLWLYGGGGYDGFGVLGPLSDFWRWGP